MKSPITIENSLLSKPFTTFLTNELWGQRVYDPSPFHVKAQGLRRGDTGPRTHHESQGRFKEMAKDELLLGMP